eukprot:m.39710 g.39710  ORF g.39710 m.39710 type:complete len:67 (+) comp11643_c0_seq3:141-341(+)
MPPVILFLKTAAEIHLVLYLRCILFGFAIRSSFPSCADFFEGEATWSSYFSSSFFFFLRFPFLASL